MESLKGHGAVIEEPPRQIADFYLGYLGGCLGTYVDVFQKFWPFVEVLFSQNGYFFEIFEIFLPRPPQKSLFIAFSSTLFPKITKKVFKIFCGAFGATKVGEINTEHLLLHLFMFRHLRRRKRGEMSFAHITPLSWRGNPF